MASNLPEGFVYISGINEWYIHTCQFWGIICHRSHLLKEPFETTIDHLGDQVGSLGRSWSLFLLFFWFRWRVFLMFGCHEILFCAWDFV